jgi:DNA (cytosine-5)-methyltransferase 1
LNADLFLLNNIISISQKLYLNSSNIPNIPITSKIKDLVQVEAVPEKFYLSAQACKGILRRKEERNMKMNSQLEKIMTKISLVEKQLITA